MIFKERLIGPWYNTIFKLVMVFLTVLAAILMISRIIENIHSVLSNCAKTT